MSDRENLQSVDVYDVFTPSIPARLNFVERPEVSERLIDAIRTPGRQVVLFGESGSGKSTIAERVLGQLYSAHVVSRCTSATSFESLLRDVLDQLGSLYSDSVSEKVTPRKNSLGVDLSVIKVSTESQQGSESTSTAKRIVGPEITAQRLAEILGGSDCCWVIEDFHKTSPETKALLAETLKVFSDSAVRFPSLKIIVIGAAATARDIVQANPDARNRVAEIQVPLMSSAEIKEVLDNGCRILGVATSPDAAQLVGLASNGLASVCHALGLYSFLRAGRRSSPHEVGNIDLADVQFALRRYIEDASDTLKAKFGAALAEGEREPVDSPRLILGILAAARLEGLTEQEILDRIRVRHAGYQVEVLTRWLADLVVGARGGLLTHSSDGRFRFTDPITHTFAQGALSIQVGDTLALGFAEILSSATSNWAQQRRLTFTDAAGRTYVIEPGGG